MFPGNHFYFNYRREFHPRRLSQGTTRGTREFETKGFTLKSPKIRMKDAPSRVKVTVLAKVK